MHHRDGGPDPTELELTAQQVFHRPTGACHTSPNYPSQPVMGGVHRPLAGLGGAVDILGREPEDRFFDSIGTGSWPFSRVNPPEVLLLG